jgi:pre-rRNA-processing protein IPI3
VTTGEQLRAWDAHFKKVTALRFTDDDSFLVSGGEDAVINVWLLAQVGAIFFLLIVIPILSFPF